MRASILLVILLVGGCNLAPKGAPTAHGIPMDPGARPSDAECAAMIRADLQAAQRIRAEFQIEGVLASEAAARAAASDASSAIGLLGIPLTPDEIAAIEDSGLGLDAHSALSFLVEAGAPERFGGQWIDPPGSDRYVVAIVGGDPATLARARCIEGGDTRYVTARQSLADGRALQQRITNDVQALQAQGIQLTMVGYDAIREKVTVGVQGLTEAIKARLVERYGDIDVSEMGPAVPG